MSLLRVEDLTVRFRTPAGTVTAVENLGFELAAGEALGIVGESGSGKSQTAFAIMGLLSDNASCSGRVLFDGHDLLQCARPELDQLRGARIGMVFQDPMTGLNPYLTVGRQMSEVLVQHRGTSLSEALAQSARMLDAVQVGESARRLGQYPHELSGGLRQRVMIAMALLCRPQLLIADEPTTALDVTVQAQLVALLARLRRELDLALLLITHDLGLVSELCDRTLVMYAGCVMESAMTETLLVAPRHPYTRALLAARPRLDTPRHGLLGAIPGAPPNALEVEPGCPFQPRCVEAVDDCARWRPSLRGAPAHPVACHLHGDS